ncbi:ribonuclease P protein component [Aphanothece hegewaldii CCALA 016]|uniref:Ribonuclease P protein component n=1 Tax=Aphanothece hegewaldii CCALA 016 TaxID=2107694 RepID=A0A2T1LUD6_9CHRO|nr:ribonuclease P protein component [Aphanothece hegewaldii]PSF35158.1 ribonuclease P protein component [Aphanothece hegewaldii CCALA 016]
MGLPLIHRLKHRNDFKAVYEQGKRHATSHLVLIVLKDVSSHVMQLSPTRFGISIGQKVSKKSVIRNRIKRQIRGAIRALLADIIPGWRVVVVVRPPAVECKYEHFLQEIKTLLTRAGLINGH